jgi:hypothetical protein
MIYYIEYLKDTLGNNYLGINVPTTIVDPYLDELKIIIGDNDYEEFTEFQKKRDGGKYHLTVINVSDYNRLFGEIGMDKFINSLEKVFTFEIDDLRMLGVGTAERSGNRTFFIVCQSDKLEAVRKRYNLPEHDFHVTLGFKWKDVFGVRKNEVLKKESKFLKLLRKEFYNNDNWNFIKRLDNFDLNQTSEIIPVEITDTRIKVKCENYYLDITYLEDGERFRIVTKYPITDELPRMSETQIAKILNKK